MITYFKNEKAHGKVNFCTGTGREGIFRIFFGLILDPPPRYICLYSEKRQIHLYRPFFSPWHGLFRKRGGLVPVYVFIFPEAAQRVSFGAGS